MLSSSGGCLGLLPIEDSLAAMSAPSGAAAAAAASFLCVPHTSHSFKSPWFSNVQAEQRHMLEDAAPE